MSADLIRQLRIACPPEYPLGKLLNQAADALTFADKRSRIRADDNEDLRRRLAAVASRLRQAEELLKPFARLAGQFGIVSEARSDGKVIWGYRDANLTYGDFRAAARFLESSDANL